MLKQKAKISLFLLGLMISHPVLAVGQFQVQGDSAQGVNQDNWSLTVTDGASENDGVFFIRPDGDSAIINVYQDATGSPASTPAVGFDYLCSADGTSCASTSALVGASSGINQINGNDGITATTNAGVTDLEITIGGVTFDRLDSTTVYTTTLDSGDGDDILVLESAVENYVSQNAITTAGEGLIINTPGTIEIDTTQVVTTIDSSDGDGYLISESAIENYVNNSKDNLGNHIATESLKVGSNLIVTTAKIVHTDTGDDNDGSNDNGMILDASGNLVVDGSVTASSDRRLKKNVQPLSNALLKVNKLQGVTYNWLDPSRGTGQKVGLIAQEVERIYPQLVETRDGYKSVNYAAMVSPLIEAVKELSAKVEDLESQMAALQ